LGEKVPNLTGKELATQFQAADWKGPREIEAFAQECENLETADVMKLVEVLSNKRSSTEPMKHRMRCSAFGKIAADTQDPLLFIPYVKMLKSGDRLLRSTVTPLLIKCNNIREHMSICDLLKSHEGDLRDFAAQILIEIAGRSALDRLAELVRQRDFPGRRHGVEILVKKSGHHAIEALVDALPVSSPKEQVYILKQLGDPRYTSKDTRSAVEAIATALSFSETNVVIAAISAFCGICEEDDFFEYVAPFLHKSELRLVQAAIAGTPNFPTPRVVDVLEQKIKEGPNSIRQAVLDAVEAIGDDTILPPLVTALANKHIAIRTRAGDILAELSKSGKLDVATTIVWLLRNPDTNVRRIAAEIISKTKDPTGKLWPKLLRFLRDQDWWVRERVKDALVDMAGTKLARHVVNYFDDPSDVVRRFAVDILHRLKDPETLGLLVRVASQDKDWWVQEKAVEAIAEIRDDRAAPYIVDIMARFEHLRIACLMTLKEIRATSAAPQVVEMLNSTEPDIRMAALDCLESLETTEYAEQVAAMATDPDPEIQKKVRDVLTRWNLKSVGDTLAKNAETNTFLDQLLVAVARRDGDYLIVAANKHPAIKKQGKLSPLVKQILTPEQVTALLTPQLTSVQIDELRSLRDVDFSYAVKSEGLRFRVNIFNQRGGLGGVFRIIKGDIPTLEDLGLPASLLKFGDIKHGLILLGGPSGSGKSTTLTAIMDYVNRNYKKHIVSLEDPIEVIHPNRKGLINQRELGTHTNSLSAALRSALRQDPDVILVGELRDFPTIQFAVTAAETGHLVFGTVHTVSASSTIDRIINAFPGGMQPQVRTMLSETLKAVICQYLLKRKDAPGMIPALEIMENNDAIGNLIRKGKTFQISQAIMTNREHGMQLMDHDLMRLYKEGKVYAEEVYMKATVKSEFEDIIDPESSTESPGSQDNVAAKGSETTIQQQN